MKSILLASTLFFNLSAFAYEIESVKYNSSTNQISVTLSFDGGNEQHVFTPAFDPCDKTTDPYGLAVRLEDSGWEDTGTEPQEWTVVFSLEDLSCLPAELTVFAGHAHHTIQIK